MKFIVVGVYFNTFQYEYVAFGIFSISQGEKKSKEEISCSRALVLQRGGLERADSILETNSGCFYIATMISN